MIRKALTAVAAATIAGTLVFGTEGYSYLKTAVNRVRSGVKSEVPVEFEIERAKQMIRDLLPDIRESTRAIAQEEVEIEELEAQIERARQNLAGERERILSLRAELEKPTGKFRYASRRATAEEIRVELYRRFDQFRTAEATLEANRRMLEARRQTLAAARQKLESMLAAKRDLEVQLQNFEARYKMLQAMQAASQIQFDDSQLARCKKLMAELRKRLEVSERVLANEGKLAGWINTDVDVPTDLEQQVDEYFQKRHETASAAADHPDGL